MTRVMSNAMRHPRDGISVGAALPVASAKRPSDREPHPPRLTRQIGQATPPMMTQGDVAQPAGFAPNLPDHRIEVRFDGLAARVMGAS